MKISSIGALRTREISIASFRDGLYCAFSNLIIVSLRTPTFSASCSCVKPCATRYDLVEEKMELLMDGTISAAIGQEPLKQGTLPLQILYDYLSLGVVPEKQYITNLSIHIKQNAYIA